MRCSRLKTFLIPAVCFFLAGCPPSAKILKESSKTARPAWIEQTPQSSEIIYAVGVHTGGESLQSSEEAAFKDALSKLAQYIGVNVHSEFKEHTTEMIQHLSREIQSKSQARLLGVTPEDSYYEKLTRLDKNFSIERYDTYVLVSYSKELAGKERNRQDQERELRALSALQFYKEGLEFSGKAKKWQAAQSFRKAIKILETLDQNVLFQGQKIQSSEKLAGLAKNELNEILLSLRKYTLEAKVSGPDQTGFAFESAMKGGLSTHGYTLSKEAPSITIAGQVVLIKGGVTLENQVFLAEGNLSALRKNDLQPILTIHVSEKGFHKEQDRSALNAAEEAGKVAAEKIAEELIKYEKKYLEE